MLVWLLACTKYDCEPLAQADGSPSGFEACRTDDGHLAYINRESAIDCAGDPLSTIPACEYPESGECSTDDECPEGDACGAAASGWAECGCWDVCATDGECGADNVCQCALELIFNNWSSLYVPTVDQCVPAQCGSGADCASGECGAVIGPCGYGINGFSCRTRDDQCRTNEECARSEYCAPTEDGYWACRGSGECE